MTNDLLCPCGQRLRLLSTVFVPEVRCHKCGTMVSTPMAPRMIYADQLDRKVMPDTAEQTTVAVYHKLASRWRHRPRKGMKWRPLAVGAVLFAAASLIYVNRLDASMFYIFTISLVGCGLIACLKGVLGYPLFG